MSYDSTVDTLNHIRRVQELLGQFACEMIRRGVIHDESKLGDIEKEHFDRETPLLKTLVYGSEEYKQSLGRLGVALRHHYANNSHHPEHYPNGVSGMTLMDLVEMFFDWKAASERTAGATMNITASAVRFEIDDQLEEIFRNTARELGWAVT